MTAKVRVDRVTKGYGAVTALGGVSLDMREGEFLTLLGPSGSGKTTLLMILAGLLEPTSGEIWIDGVDTTHLPSFRRDIGMVFQNYALFPHLTIFENIAFPLRMRKTSEAEIRKRVGEVLEAVQLPHVGDRLPRELSGGQQQRIALARCIVYRPSIILMDEPLGALDKKLRDQLQLEIKRLHMELGITVLYVTHDQEEAMVLSDRICLMNGGAIEQIGSAADLYFRPASMFAAHFLGESNAIQGRYLDRVGTHTRMTAAGGQVLSGVSERNYIAGDEINCIVRPEALKLLDDAGGSAVLDNSVTATVSDVILVGGVTRIYALLADGTRVLSVQLTSREGARARSGDTVRLGWRADDGIVLPAPVATQPE